MPFAPRKILVPTDFSPSAAAAADAAVALARRFEAQVTLLHALPLSEYTLFSTGDVVSFDAVALQKAVRASAEKASAAELARLSAAQVALGQATVDGPPPAEICSFAAQKGFDLIVMGSHGRTGISRF